MQYVNCFSYLRGVFQETMYHRLLYLILVFGFSLTNLAAQSQQKIVGKRLREYFRTYEAEDVDVGTCKLVRFQLDPKDRTLIIHANANFAYQPFRPEITTKIYDELRRVLPGPVNYYDITLLVGGKSIDELIPNIYRKTKDETRLWGKTTHRDQPWVSNASRPYVISEGLQSRHLAITPSHGLYYKNDSASWEWQRPSLYCTREDLLTQSIVIPYLTPMLESAGAVVFSARERDRQPYDIIIDNDNIGHDHGLYIEEKHHKTEWKNGAVGFAIPEGLLLHGDNPFNLGSSRTISTTENEESAEGAALWIPNIPERGEYAVYVAYQTYPTSVPDAEYLVVHAGGTTHIKVNQQMGGGTWVYLGTFEFEKGQRDDQMVILTNHSKYKGIVSADAVRFGGGTAIVNRGSADTIRTSRMPRYYEGARYNAQWAGFPVERYANYNGEKDYAEDINSRSLVTNYLLGGSIYCPDSVGLRVPIELSLGVHTDAGIREDDTTVGTLGIYTTGYNDGKLGNGILSRYTSRDLTDMVLTYIAGITDSLARRSMWDKNYSESRLPDVPSCIIELLSHQNFADMRYAHDPHFKFAAARAIYKALLHYTAEMHGTKYTIQPLPIQAFNIQFVEGNKVRLSWRPTLDEQESNATPDGYVLYTRIDDKGWDNGQRISSSACDIVLEADHMYSFKVTAINRGGESFPSEVLAAHISSESKGKVLVVNGFQRIDGPAVVNMPHHAGFDLLADPGVPYIGTTAYSGLQYEFSRKMIGHEDESLQMGASGSELEGTYVAGNTMDYAAVHGSSIKNAGYSFVSCSRQSFEEGTVKPQNFDVVDAFMGLQRKTDYSVMKHPEYLAITPAMYAILSHYAQQGGALMMSGSYLGEESQTNITTQALLNKVFHAKENGYINNWIEQGIYGLGTTMEIPRWLNPEQYAVTRPEILTPIGDAFTPLVYENSRHSAAVAYRGVHRSILLGFPFEAIRSVHDRDMIMEAVLNFLTKQSQ